MLPNSQAWSWQNPNSAVPLLSRIWRISPGNSDLHSQTWKGILGGDCSAMQLHRALRNGQPQSNSTVFYVPSFLNAKEWLEDLGERFCRNTRAVVSDRNGCELGILGKLNLDCRLLW